MSNLVVKTLFTSDPSDVIKVTTSLGTANVNDLADVDTSEALPNNALLIWDTNTAKYKPIAYTTLVIDGQTF